MVSAVNYFHLKAPSQMSDTVLNMPRIYMVTEKLYFTGQLTLLTSKVVSAEPLT